MQYVIMVNVLYMQLLLEFFLPHDACVILFWPWWCVECSIIRSYTVYKDDSEDEHTESALVPLYVIISELFRNNACHQKILMFTVNIYMHLFKPHLLLTHCALYWCVKWHDGCGFFATVICRPSFLPKFCLILSVSLPNSASYHS